MRCLQLEQLTSQSEDTHARYTTSANELDAARSAFKRAENHLAVCQLARDETAVAATEAQAQSTLAFENFEKSITV